MCTEFFIQLDGYNFKKLFCYFKMILCLLWELKSPFFYEISGMLNGCFFSILLGKIQSFSSYVGLHDILFLKVYWFVKFRSLSSVF